MLCEVLFPLSPQKTKEEELNGRVVKIFIQFLSDKMLVFLRKFEGLADPKCLSLENLLNYYKKVEN